MKRFRFSLQTVHDLRQMRRDAAERELAEATVRVSEARAELVEMEGTRHALTETYALALGAGLVNPYEAVLRTNYLADLVKRESAASVRLKELEREREARRQTVALAAQEAEATTKLRERHHARHQAEAARSEQNSLDEIATLAAARRHTLNT